MIFSYIDDPKYTPNILFILKKDPKRPQKDPKYTLNIRDIDNIKYFFKNCGYKKYKKVYF